MKNDILKQAGLNALGTVLYVACVALFMSYTPQLFAEVKEKTALIPIAMLLLLIVSASITGSLVLGKPILWYLDGKKKDAVHLLIATIGCLFLTTVVAFVALAVFGR